MLFGVSSFKGVVKELMGVPMSVFGAFGDASKAFNSNMITMDATGTSMFKNLTASSGQFFKTFWAGLSKTSKFLIIIAAFEIARKTIDKLVVTLKEQKEKVKESLSAYEEAKDELSNITSEIKKNEEAMDELLKKDKLTYVEKGELDNLKEATRELQLQQDLAEKESERKAKKLATDSVELVERQYAEVSADRTDEYIAEGAGIAGLVSDPNDASALIAAYKKYEVLLEEAIADGDKRAKEEYIRNMGEVKDAIFAIMGGLNEQKNNIKPYYDYIKDIPYEQLTTEQKKIVDNYNYLNDAVDYIYSQIDPNGWKSTQIDGVFSNPVVEKTKDELVEMAESYELTPDTIKSYEHLNRELEESGVSAEELCEEIYAIADATEEVDEELPTYTDIVSNVEKELSDGFEQLDKIYKDVLDKEDFDYSSILNNEDFKNTFGKYKEEYNNFIKTITNSPNDINKCKEAFNKLATEYINGSGILDDLTVETKDVTVAMLKQMGVSNALDIVNERLAAEEAKLKINIEDSIDVIYDQVEGFCDSAEATDYARKALYSYIVQEKIFNNTSLSTASKIRQLEQLARAFGITADAAGTAGLQTSMANEIKIAQRDGASAAEIEAIKQSYLNYASSKYQAAIESKFSSLSSTVKYTGGASSNSSSGGSSEETFDWIDVALQRVQRTITNLEKTVSATYKVWSKRNKALADEITSVNKEISIQQKSYDFYMKKANAVGLSKTYQDLVKNGAIKIDTIKDEKLANKIKSYQEFYDKAIGCQDAIADLRDELANLARTKFDNVSKEFEDKLSVIEHEINMVDSYINQAEAKGHIVSSNYYSSIMKLEKDNIDMLEKEYNSLNNALEEAMKIGQIEKYSEEWYSMYSEINSVKEAIVEANTSLIEYQNTMRELEWEVFDKIQEFKTKVTDESGWIIELMGNEKMHNEDDGAITKYGQATMGLHALNYNAYLLQAEDYAKEIKDINAEIAKDPNNQNLLERRQELLESQRDMIKAAEDEKQSIKDLVSNGYDSFLNAMQEMIDKRKEFMSSVKELYDYEKDISEKTKNISSLEKQYNAYLGDDSEEAMSKIQQIKVSLDEAKKDLEQTEYEKYLSDQEQMLDNLYSEAEEWINTRLDNLDALIQNVIDETNKNSDTIKDTIETVVGNVGAELSDEMDRIWSTDGSLYKVVSMYNDGFNTHATTINNTLLSIKESIDAMIKESDKEADKNLKDDKETVVKPSGGTTNNNTSSGSSSNTSNNSSSGSSNSSSSSSSSSSSNSSSSTASKWGSWFIKKKYSGSKSSLSYNTSLVDRLKYKDFDYSYSARGKYYKAMGGSGTYSGTSKQNSWMLAQMKSHGFEKGGTIGGLINRTGEDGFILARTGEEILSLEKIRELQKAFAYMNPMADMISSMQRVPHVESVGNTIKNDIKMDIILDKVKDVDEFITALKTDKKFEKFIQQITIGNAIGKNNLSKYKYY